MDELEPLPDVLLAALREGYAVWDRGGPQAMAAEGRWDPDIVWYDPPDFPDSAVHRGLEAVTRHLELRLEALGRASLSLKAARWVSEQEGVVLVELSLATGGRTSGLELPKVPLLHVMRIRDGRALEVREFLSADQALAFVRRSA